MSERLIDVIIPAYTETLDHLYEAIVSLDALRSLKLDQEARPIVVFNGPGAKEVSDEWWGKRIISRGVTSFITDEYITALGGGCRLCHARNEGLRAASAPYIAFLDADDFFLPAIADVHAAALGHRGAFGDALIAHADGSAEFVRDQSSGPLGAVQPCTGSFIVRRDVAPAFDVWATHQFAGKPNYDWWWWRAIGDEDIAHVPTQAMVYRYNWTERSATWQYKANAGWIGVGTHPVYG